MDADQARALSQAPPVGEIPAHGAGLRQSTGLRQLLLPAVALYVVARVLLLVEAVVIARVHHLSMATVLTPWDASYYARIATSGYPAQVDVHRYSTIAFFPLYPLVGLVLHWVTRLPIAWALLVVTWLAGVAVVVGGGLLACREWGARRGRQAALLLAVFPGTVVLSLTYADGLAVALAAGSLLALNRRRYLLSGLSGAAAGAALSIMVEPLVAAMVVFAAMRREVRALLAAVLVPLGTLAYLGYLWAHTGSPFTWWRVEHYAWGLHVSLPTSAHTGYTTHAFAHPQVATITAMSLLVAAIGLAALIARRAPAHWFVFVLAIFAALTFDGGGHMTPRHLFDALPGVLALGASLPRRALAPALVISLAALVFLFAVYTPRDFLFLAV